MDCFGVTIIGVEVVPTLWQMLRSVKLNRPVHDFAEMRIGGAGGIRTLGTNARSLRNIP